MKPGILYFLNIDFRTAVKRSENGRRFEKRVALNFSAGCLLKKDVNVTARAF